MLDYFSRPVVLVDDLDPFLGFGRIDQCYIEACSFSERDDRSDMSLTFKPLADAGNRLDDTWLVANSTDDIVILVTVEVVGAHTYDADAGRLLSRPLEPADDGLLSGVTLRFDDEDLQTDIAKRQSWSGVEVPLGSTLHATILNNRELRLTYRRMDSLAEETIVIRGNI